MVISKPIDPSLPYSAAIDKLRILIPSLPYPPRPDWKSGTIRVLMDNHPSEEVYKAIAPSLYRQIVQTPLQKFALQIPTSLKPVIRDRTKVVVEPGDITIGDIRKYISKNGWSFSRFRDVVFKPQVVLQEKFGAQRFLKPAEAKIPYFEADIQLPTDQDAEINFTAEFPNAKVGDAYIFHVMQLTPEQQIVGGLTIVAVIVETPPNILAADGLAKKALYPDPNEPTKTNWIADLYRAIGCSVPPQQSATCLRDLRYYLNLIIESCRDGSVQPLDQNIPNYKEMNGYLGISNSCFIKFYQFVKDTHGLTGEAATIANSYLDHAINLLSS